MNQDEIIEMAIDAWKEAGEGWVDKNWFEDRAKALKAFAKLVDAKATAKEREACAKVCDDIDAECEGEAVSATWCSKAIRARSGDTK